MMEYLLANALDILYLALAFMAIGLTLFLIPVLIRVAGLLKNVNRLTTEIQDTVELVQSYLWQPARFVLSIKSGLGNMLEIIRRYLKK